jgi:three-Cys-motif partner protein
MSAKRGDDGHRFGGEWTNRKLDVLAKYLSAYTTALKKTPFEKLYIDAFAGTGYREARGDVSELATSGDQLFPDLAEPEPQRLLAGSARRALATTPAFDRYIFIERNAARCAELEKLKVEFPLLAAAIDIRRKEANAEIQALCSGSWRSRRAVLFLDPYGMQVDWSTLEAIAQTRAIDLWVLFPLGIGVNRLLKRSGDIPPPWRQALDRLLGTDTWFDEFYKVEATPSLFGGDEERPVKASTETIGRYFNDRLARIFAGTAPAPAVLRNSRNVPLYLLCFAVGNPRGKDIALRIANHLLREEI